MASPSPFKLRWWEWLAYALFCAWCYRIGRLLTREWVAGIVQEALSKP